MNIQRFKFAWARGARIQFCSNPEAGSDATWSISGVFEHSHMVPGFEYRVHPKDEHLQYGPLSTGLIQSVIHEQTLPMFHACNSVAIELFPELAKDWWELTSTDRLMQFLFLAEVLADEGL